VCQKGSGIGKKSGPYHSPQQTSVADSEVSYQQDLKPSYGEGKESPPREKSDWEDVSNTNNVQQGHERKRERQDQVKGKVSSEKKVMVNSGVRLWEN